MKIILRYKQRCSNPSYIIEERFGSKTIITTNGYTDYDQEEEIEEFNINKRINELKSITNKNYHSFEILKTMTTTENL